MSETDWFRGWNYGDMLDLAAATVPPERPALIHGDRVIAWRDFDSRSNRLARALLARGATPGDKIAIYTRNRPEYMEALAAVLKARLVPVNVNYRYGDDELHYIFDNSDAVAAFYAGEFADRVLRLKPRLPHLRGWIGIEDGTGIGALADYEDLAAQGDGRPLGLARSPDDLFFIYTGGTTGMPKAVMWQQGDLIASLLQSPLTPEPPQSLAAHAAAMRANPNPVTIPAAPMMHAVGLLTGIGTLANGGTVVTLTGASFSPVELWQAVHDHRVTRISLVGDVFARPMLEALDAAPGRFDTSSVVLISSSGVMWTDRVKAGLIGHMPQVTLADSLGASEAVGMGYSLTTKDGIERTARFALGPTVRVFTEEGRDVAPGSGEPGVVARGGPIPVGYYKDPEKSAKTFRTVAGRRWSMPGDWATVDQDGTLALLGRGSVCINTGGEKVYAEEVEEILKTAPGVTDALVVGVPDERWGQAIVALVDAAAGARVDEEAVRAHVRARLAGYKVPKRILAATPGLLRAPNGKADYKGALAFARTTLER